MIYDTITYNGEEELFEIRYNVLKDFVDEFRVIEFDQTFSGKPRARLFTQNWPKVKSYYVTEDIWSKYEELAKSSPNTEYGKGASHWLREFCQKESIKDFLTDLKDDDLVFIGDCDELYEPTTNYTTPQKIKLKVYSYWLNNRSNEEFWGTLVARYGDIKNECLNHIRSRIDIRGKYEHGSHFTSIGGYEKVKKKLTDSYTEESYASPQVIGNLKENIDNKCDFLGRHFNYIRDEESWPQYLTNNRDRYRHICLE